MPTARSSSAADRRYGAPISTIPKRAQREMAATKAGAGADALRSAVPVTVDFAVEIAGEESSST